MSYETVVPEGFIAELKEMPILQVVLLREQFKRIPADAAFLRAVDVEIRNRALSSASVVQPGRTAGS